MSVIDRIKNNRETILTGEIGALLHDVGKLHPDFVKSKSVEKSASDIHAQIDKFLKHELIEFIKNSKFDIKIGKEKSNIYNLITQHHERDENKIGNIIKLLKRSDQKDSADDKGIVRKKQHLNDTWIASPFGYKKERIDLGCLQKRFEDLEGNLTRLFKNYISGNLGLNCFRESLINNLKTVFSHALGETRIPANDVTLWDHSYSTASLFKSLLAAKVSKAEIDQKNPQWRIFGILWNGIEFINKGKKIAEIQSRSEIIENIKRALKNKFEDKIPIGNAIYEDTNGIYFTFPDLKDKSKELAKECAKKALEIIYKESDNEIWPFFTLSKSSRSLTVIADELRFASEKRKIPRMTSTLFVEGQEKEYFENPVLTTPTEGQDVCPICRIRPKDTEKERCDVCEKRRKGRLTGWLDNRQSTIWTSEAADKNNRVALISLSFNLDKWFDGTMVGTIYSQSFEDWRKSQKTKKFFENSQNTQKLNKKGVGTESNPIKLSRDLLKIITDDEDISQDTGFKSNLMNIFFEDIKSSQVKSDENYVGKFIDNLKLRLDTKLDTKLFNSSNLQKLLFTRNPSPACLYRTWQETKEFFDLVIREIRNRIYSNKWKRIKFTIDMDKFYWFNWNNLKKEEILPFLKSLGIIRENEGAEIKPDKDIIKIKVGKREIKILKDKDRVKLETKVKFCEFTFNEKSGKVYRINNTTPYIVQIDNLEPQYLLVFHNKNGEFYTIESLEKFRLKKDGKIVKEGEEAVEKATTQGFKHLALEDKPNDNLLIEGIKYDEIKSEDYYPLIEINKSPLSLRFMIPALDSVKIIELITKLYNERFEKVIGKLPLNVGLLVSKRQFPLYVLLNAENRMLKGDKLEKQVSMNPWWNVDGIRNDRYYGFYPTKSINKGDKYTLDDLSSISKEKIFSLYTGYFDFDLLLGTTDKYKIGYDKENGKRADDDYKLFTGRPYHFYQFSEMLKLREVLSNLSNSQINFIEEMLTSKLREWKNVEDENKTNIFREFAEATLKNAFGEKWNKLRDETRFFLVSSAINKLLLDTITLFRHVIKKEVTKND